MGIPAYFIHIVKNYPNIIKKYLKEHLTVSNLYMDCNSIIYDAVRNILETNINNKNISRSIISQVILKIENYISVISPTQNVIIAFDGVCPIAKMSQQRNRRYKSNISSSIQKSYNENKPLTEDFNTTCITPGTEFMESLNSSINFYFTQPYIIQKYNSLNIIISTSDEPGEGEHKIFQYIRNNPMEHTGFNTIIYGLDADLIMLSINHLNICPDIFLYRETPEFIKSIDNSLEPNESYLLNISELSKSTHIQYNDYIFLCFFLGNDFLPHFPALNIRTGGIDKLLNAYKATIKDNENLIVGKIIQWKNVRKLVAFLLSQEEEFIKKEMKMRDKKEKIMYPNETPQDKFRKFEASPQYIRDMEKYINPFNDGWQSRYYNTLFNCDNTKENTSQISINYIEGLEWTMKYYSVDCPDWTWCYKYNYPPLLQDLYNSIPYNETNFIIDKPSNPVSPITQLCYVMSRESLQFLPKKLQKYLIENIGFFYPEQVDFVWCYCRYFWESHVILPEIPIFEKDGENSLCFHLKKYENSLLEKNESNLYLTR